MANTPQSAHAGSPQSDPIAHVELSSQNEIQDVHATHGEAQGEIPSTIEKKAPTTWTVELIGINK